MMTSTVIDRLINDDDDDDDDGDDDDGDRLYIGVQRWLLSTTLTPRQK